MPAESDVELLWAAARPRPDLASVAEAAIDANLDVVLAAARHQRVTPLVLGALEAAGVELVGEAVTTARREVAFRRGQELVALKLIADQALVPLHEAGLTALVHKGAALVGRYPRVGTRPMDDVDVVVPPDRFEHAIWVLEAAGWVRGAHSRELPDPGYDVPMLHPRTGGMPLEIHHDLQRRTQRTSGLDAERLWAERVPSSVCGAPVWGVPPEVELLALATHAAKPFHVFNRLIWAVDFAVVVAAAEQFDWDLVARLVVELRCRTAVAVALRLAQRLGAEVPDDLTVLPSMARRTGALEPILDPTWPFLSAGRNRRGYALALVDDGRARSRLIVDEVIHRDDGRSRTRTVGDIVGAASRLARRAPLRSR